jgi:tetratricopeptide (TPR) repeat protein
MSVLKPVRGNSLRPRPVLMKTRLATIHGPAHLSSQAGTDLLESGQLISRTALEAYQSRDYEVCDALLARYEAQCPLPMELLTLRGQSLIAQGRLDEAIEALEIAHANSHDPQVNYHLAYAHEQLGCHEQAVVLIDDETLRDVPEAIILKMRALHRLGRLDESIELGMRSQAHVTHGKDVCGLLANVLIDAGRCGEARRFVERAHETADGCTAGGLLALDALDRRLALTLFRRALSLDPQSSRARLGEGLCLLGFENHAAAALCFDHAATLLDRHAGAWVVAAWVHLLNLDIAQARARFERGCHVDRGFAEAHGGLALVCLYEGNIDEAGVHAEQSIRLSRDCLSGTLALSLLLAQAGDFSAAQQARQSIACHPLGRDGLSIAKGLARRAMRHTSPS